MIVNEKLIDKYVNVYPNDIRLIVVPYKNIIKFIAAETDNFGQLNVLKEKIINKKDFVHSYNFIMNEFVLFIFNYLLFDMEEVESVKYNMVLNFYVRAFQNNYALYELKRFSKNQIHEEILKRKKAFNFPKNKKLSRKKRAQLKKKRQKRKASALRASVLSDILSSWSRVLSKHIHNNVYEDVSEDICLYNNVSEALLKQKVYGFIYKDEAQGSFDAISDTGHFVDFKTT